MWFVIVIAKRRVKVVALRRCRSTPTFPLLSRHRWPATCGSIAAGIKLRRSSNNLRQCLVITVRGIEVATMRRCKSTSSVIPLGRHCWPATHGSIAAGIRLRRSSYNLRQCLVITVRGIEVATMRRCKSTSSVIPLDRHRWPTPLRCVWRFFLSTRSIPK